MTNMVELRSTCSQNPQENKWHGTTQHTQATKATENGVRFFIWDVYKILFFEVIKLVAFLEIPELIGSKVGRKKIGTSLVRHVTTPGHTDSMAWCHREVGVLQNDMVFGLVVLANPEF